MLKKLFYTFLVLVVGTTLTAAGTLYWLVVLNPGEEIKAENIQAILGKESHVFYSDNKTPLGVFFDQSHRQYVTFGEIPENFVNALVASEDNRFFNHIGFDIVGIVRAAIKNFQAGRVVQGGSTLTQQTAKNLFERTERSLQAKLKELLYALRLEHHYSKEKIFEFYANQFYVSGNGHGLGVAARYYFDKKPEELTLVECAFIAGSVKRPNYYNPFIKKSDASADLARQRAKTRLKYVLDKLLELEMIGLAVYQESLKSEISFKHGKVGYSLDYAMEMVKDAVSTTEVLDALAKHGVENVATSGIRIITTVDRELQQKTLYALRHELSRLDVRLRGYERDEVQEEYEKIDYSGDGKLQEDAFLFGTIISVEGTQGDLTIEVDFGRKIGVGIIDREGLERIVDARVKWEKQLWSEPASKDLDRLVAQLQPGDKAWVSVRKIRQDSPALLELEKFPEVQGAALVMREGAILAMAGGVENRHFNRAVYARRTMGSSYKPFVFAAALQLGWNSADLLQNKRDVFVYHNQPYFPRPDHISAYDQVTMSWAGVHSENVASVWLATHLCDQLSPAQFYEVAEHLGLTPKIVDGEKEPYRSYRSRIRDRFGIVVDRDILRAAAYRRAINNIEADFMFENMVAEYGVFRALPYGLGFDTFSQQIDRQLSGSEKISSAEQKELVLRKEILSLNYMLLADLRQSLQNYAAVVEDPLGVFDPSLFATEAGAAELYYDLYTGEYLYYEQSPSVPHLQKVDKRRLQQYLFSLADQERLEFWKKIRLDGVASVAAVDLLARQIDVEYQRLQEKLPYSFEVLASVEDFRIFVGLSYLSKLGREFGIKSKLEPVLSFPLGSNVVSLLETTRMYETMITGKLTTYGGTDTDDESAGLALLDRIESADGKVLYRPERREQTVIGTKSRVAVGHILENTVKFGTGRNADRNVRLNSNSTEGSEIDALDLSVPLLGKTGTANRYTNASFFGYLPGLADSAEALVTRQGYAVGVYVGYDDNKPMRQSSTRITGAAGALPTWIDIVKVLLREHGYADQLDPVDLSFYGLRIKREADGQINVAVDQHSGGKVVEPVQIVSDANRSHPSIITFGKKSADGRFEAERRYEPFWRVVGEKNL